MRSFPCRPCGPTAGAARCRRLPCWDVDGVRDYPDDPRRWYAGGDDGYDGYQVPDPRQTEPAGRPGRGYGDEGHWESGAEQLGGGPFSAFGSRGAGQPQVASLPEDGEHTPDRFRTVPIDPASLRRAQGAPQPGGPPGPGVPAGLPPGAGGAVYRARRAGAGLLFAAAAVVAEVLLAKVLLQASFGDRASFGGVLAGIFGLAGVPLVAIGLYALVTGAASVGPTHGRPWLHPPLAYLPVGLRSEE